jgi:hypothetical protein
MEGKTMNKHLESHETNEFVLRVGRSVAKTIDEEIKKLVPEQRWLIHARIINILFQSFYRPQMNLADDEIEKAIAEELKKAEG